MKDAGKKGFTIVELMMGMVASTIIAIAVGSMLYYGWLGWRQSMDAASMQRNAMLAMKTVENRIRNAKAADISGTGSKSSFVGDTDYLASEIAPDANISLKSFNVSSNTYGGIEIAFTLATSSEDYQKTYNMTVYPRN
jgi:Tfp pilus assembly protein PilW